MRDRDRDILELRGRQEAVYSIVGPDTKLTGDPHITQDFGKGQDESDRFRGVMTLRKPISEAVVDTRTIKATGKNPREVLRKLEMAYKEYYAVQDD